MEVFKQFTWGQFLLLVVIATAAYYIFIIVKHRIDIPAVLGFRKAAGQHNMDMADDDDEPYQPVDADEDENPTMDELEELVEDIRHRILEAGNGKPKDELLDQIVIRASNFGGLHLPAYRYALNNYIMSNANELCGVEFSEEELEERWDGLLRK